MSEVVVLLAGSEVPSGIVKLRNIGKFGLWVGGVDAKGNPLQPPVMLKPGESLASYVPPANAVKIVMVADKQSEGQPPMSGWAVLEYELPWMPA